MEIVAILRVLLGHRLLLAIGALLGLTVSITLAYQVSLSPPWLTARQQQVVSMSTRVLIDAPAAPAIDPVSRIADTLALRASLLADLMATEEVSGRIAVKADLPHDELAVISPSMGSPPLNIPIAVRATEAAAATHEPYILRLTASSEIAIIAMEAFAPNVVEARRLAEAAVTSLDEVLKRRPTRGQPVSVQRLGRVAMTVTPGDSPQMVAAVAGVVIFALWAGAIVLLVGIARRVRRMSSAGAAGESRRSAGPATDRSLA